MDTVQIEVWVLVDQDGDYVIATDGNDLEDAYEEKFGGDPGGLSQRRVKVTLTVPKPKPVELSATIAEEPAVGHLEAR